MIGLRVPAKLKFIMRHARYRLSLLQSKTIVMTILIDQVSSNLAQLSLNSGSETPPSSSPPQRASPPLSPESISDARSARLTLTKYCALREMTLRRLNYLLSRVSEDSFGEDIQDQIEECIDLLDGLALLIVALQKRKI